MDRSRVRLAALAAATVCLAAVSGGCTVTRDCTEIGALSGVSLDLRAGSWAVQDFCVDDVCADAAEPVFVRVDDEPASYRFRFTAESPTGTLLARDGVVATKEYFVNGEGCDPRTAQATVVVDAAGDVTVVAP